MVTFRVIDKKVRPMGSGGIASSSIGAPSRVSITGALPKTSGGGLFSPEAILDRTLSFAISKKDQARDAIREEQGSRGAIKEQVTKEGAEIGRKELSETAGETISIIEGKLSGIPKGRTKKQKEKYADQTEEIEKTLEEVKSNKWLVDNYNINNSVRALKFKRDFLGDKDAARILLAIQANDWKKAKRLDDEYSKKITTAYSQQSKEDSKEASKKLVDVGYRLNVRGVYIPTKKTIQIAEDENFDIPSDEVDEVINSSQVATPPTLNPAEIKFLSLTPAGRQKLKEWGIAKPPDLRIRGMVLHGIAPNVPRE